MIHSRYVIDKQTLSIKKKKEGKITNFWCINKSKTCIDTILILIL